MKTIIVLYCAGPADYYVGIVDGVITDQQKEQIADQWDAEIESHETWDDDDDDDNRRIISFRETEEMTLGDDGIDINGKQTNLISI